MDIAIGSMLTKSQRIILGLVVLILVDVIWVSSAELTKYIYKQETFRKPFFCTYVKTSMFTLYLFGFLLWPHWKDSYCSRPSNYIYLESDQEDNVSFEEPMSTRLSNPIYIPVKIHDNEITDKSSETESDDSSIRSVRFQKVAEVRQLSEAEAKDALLARLSYQASLKANDFVKRATKFSVYQVSKVAFIFCLLWFAANYTYQVALLKTEAGIVNILSSTSSLFTFILAAIYPSSPLDKFTISKLFAVILSIIGIVVVSVSDLKFESDIPVGSVLSLLSAFFYAIYLVFLKRTVKHEDNIDIPMFFGFVGLFNLLLLWPLFFFLHFSKLESFEWPTREQMMLLFLNGLMGTVISEALWLWGCFLTSSLMATVAISMTIPMTMMADVILKNVTYSSLFYFGTIPMIVSFFMVTIYSHFENWDPILSLLRCAYNKICYKTVSLHSRLRESTSEQREALIGVNGDSE